MQACSGKRHQWPWPIHWALLSRFCAFDLQDMKPRFGCENKIQTARLTCEQVAMMKGSSDFAETNDQLISVDGKELTAVCDV